MKKSQKAVASPRFVLDAATAADLMTPNPVSIRTGATVQEAVAFLTDRGFSAAPVIDAAGRPVGVLSRADIVVHNRETAHAPAAVPDYYEKNDLSAPVGEGARAARSAEQTDTATVSDLMTPAVFSVTPETPAAQVIEQILALKVHRLFVVGRDGVLRGVISTLDVLGRLRPDGLPPDPAAAGLASRSGSLDLMKR
jgi:CBS domain-containing protein